MLSIIQFIPSLGFGLLEKAGVPNLAILYNTGSAFCRFFIFEISLFILIFWYPLCSHGGKFSEYFFVLFFHKILVLKLWYFNLHYYTITPCLQFLTNETNRSNSIFSTVFLWVITSSVLMQALLLNPAGTARNPFVVNVVGFAMKYMNYTPDMAPKK